MRNCALIVQEVTFTVELGRNAFLLISDAMEDETVQMVAMKELAVSAYLSLLFDLCTTKSNRFYWSYYYLHLVFIQIFQLTLTLSILTQIPPTFIAK